MKEVKLSDYALSCIKDIALRQYLDKAIDYRKPENFLCTCYVQATITYLSSKGYVIQDGKVYEKENPTS